MSYRSRTNRNIKRALKKGGFYDTRPFFKMVHGEEVKVPHNYKKNKNESINIKPEINMTSREEKIGCFLLILIIVLVIIIFNVDNIQSFFVKKKSPKILKSEITKFLEENDVDNYTIQYYKVDEDCEAFCGYDLSLYYDGFYQLDSDKMYYLLDELEHFSTTNGYYINNVSINSNNDTFTFSLGSIYKNGKVYCHLCSEDY